MMFKSFELSSDDVIITAAARTTTRTGVSEGFKKIKPYRRTRKAAVTTGLNCLPVWLPSVLEK